MWILGPLLACGSSEGEGTGEAPPADAVAAHEKAHEHAEAHPAEGHEGSHDHDRDHDGGMPHRFDDAERWATVFDDPARDEWQRPADVVTALALTEGQAVADIGAGTGYMNRHLAAAVGATGRVIAIDIEPTLIAHMAERAKREGTPQVEARLGTGGEPKLAPGEVDAVLLVDTVHHIENRAAYFTALRKAFRPPGRLVIVDFDPDGPESHGPPKAHRLSLPQVAKELEAAGYTRVGMPESLPYQWVGVFHATP